MVAMPAAPFLSPSSPLRFRGIPDTLAASHVEGSECCLIHADNLLSGEKGVFLNPNVRVGYNGTSYDAIQKHKLMSPWEIFGGIWYNRVLRWCTTPTFKEWIVRRRVEQWQDGDPVRWSEPGEFCLVNEMQVLHDKGWRHV